MKILKLSRGEDCLLDDDWYELIQLLSWHKGSDGYARRRGLLNGKPRNEAMHRVIMGALPGQQVDHVNGNKLDNQKKNLRLCTHQQNQMNKKPRLGCSSNYKGVCWDKGRKKWLATIKGDTGQIHLGRHDKEKEAALAYNKKAKELFGEFAWLNKI